MSSNVFGQSASADIILKLDDFEGPIELLLHLAKCNGLDIYTLKISSIVDQYMAYIDGIDKLDLDTSSEFLLMATVLLSIKAKSLLPVEEVIEEESDEISQEEEIRRLMIEYALFQEKATEIHETETLNRFYREPEFDDKSARLSVKGFNLDKLMEAYAKVLFKFTKEEEIIDTKTIERDEYTVAEQLDFLVAELIANKKLYFYELFDEMANKNEVINTFLALLQLVSKQFAKINQETLTSDIIIEINDNCDIETYDYSLLESQSKEDNFDEEPITNN